MAAFGQILQLSFHPDAGHQEMTCYFDDAAVEIRSPSCVRRLLVPRRHGILLWVEWRVVAVALTGNTASGYNAIDLQ